MFRRERHVSETFTTIYKGPSRSRIFQKVDFFSYNPYIKVCRIRPQTIFVRFWP